MKQEGDLLLLFELFLKTEQSNGHTFNEYLNWLEISQSNCTIDMWEVSAIFTSVALFTSSEEKRGSLYFIAALFSQLFVVADRLLSTAKL